LPVRKEILMEFSDFKLNPSWDEQTVEMYKKFHKEIWEDQEYFRHGLNIKEGDVVVDCGASIGIFSLLAASKKAKKIISFEFDPSVYEYLVKNSKKIKKIVPVNALVNNRDIKYLSDNTPKEQVDLAKILKKYELKNIDFLKLDVEGFEFAFILNESDDNILKVKQWAIETHSCGFFADRLQECYFTLAILDRFKKLGYECVLEKLHIDTCCYTIYARLN